MQRVKGIIKKLGVFDSGVGGLSVLNELKKLPIQEIIYVADTANLPYGEKTPEQITSFSRHIITFLLNHKVDALVIACHTASAVALEQLQKEFPSVLICGVVEPVVHAALATTKNNRIGVIGTPATIASNIHKTKILTRNAHANVITQACPKFVPLIESGLYKKEELYVAFQEYLSPVQQSGCDTLIIGCTHYELILKEIDIFLEKKISLISAPLKAAQTLKTFFQDAISLSPVITYYVTGNVEHFKKNAAILTGLQLEKVMPIQLSTTKTVSNFSIVGHQDV